MTFEAMRDEMLLHFSSMTTDTALLYTVNLDKDRLWSLYLDSFPADQNPVYRERPEHDCSCCRNFIKSFGNVVAIKNGKVVSLWDFDVDNDRTYGASIKAMREYVHSCCITDVFFSKETQIGIKSNKELYQGEILVHEHFYAKIPQQFICKNAIEDKKASLRDTRNVFKRSLDELTADSVNVVLELISQGSLYRGEEHKGILEKFSDYKAKYDKLNSEQKELFAWEMVKDAGVSVGRIRNHSIGTLLEHISEGVDLDEAVRRYEAIVAPSNYKRPKAIFTKKMLEDAKKTISDLGYMDSLKRRYATLDDITVNNILFSNRDAAKRISGGDVFDEMAESIPLNPKKFNKVEEISIDNFIANVLPKTKELELLFENKLSGNLVSLIAPQDKDSKTMFKWNNNFCWAYSGNLTDSMKERVKAAGGRVDGDLRFSIQWNEEGLDNCDLDAHCKEANGHEIYFGTSKKPAISKLGGQLDVDIIHPDGRIAVENITYADRSTMIDGTYDFFVHQYSGNATKGFRAEVEYDGQIYYFDYPYSMKHGDVVKVAQITLCNGSFSIKPILPEGNVSSREVWGLSTNQFVPISVVMLSPNYWDKQNGIGNKHYFFMLKGCVNPETPNGFYNEFLNNELDKHKKVMEALGSKLAVESADDQLSGVGFSSTKHNSIIVKVKGETERTLKILF